MAHWLRVHIILPEDASSIPNIGGRDLVHNMQGWTMTKYEPSITIDQG